MNNENDTLDTAIAIIGMACRFPEANNIAELWQNLKNGIESIKFFSKEELLAVGIEETLLDNPNYIRAKAFLSHIDKFDASFFGYSPKEAELIDPQQRIFLELAWQALEIAGYDSEQYPGQIGVYAGIGLNTYLLNNLINNTDIFTSSRRHQAVLGNDKDFLPTRVSYKLNLTGPSMTVQTACSTSLVATCLACQSLLDYHSDIALAGGVSVTIWQKKGYFHEEGGIYSRDGHCRVFDAQSTGTAAGEGAGIVVLKRLKEALADGDSIYAVIKGFALNNDGSEKIGYTAPSVDGQANVIAEAQAVANVTPKEITYVETHGTGTILGDPIEIAALTKAFRGSTDKTCAIGSIKSNFGHTDTAAGVAGLIKTALALQNKQIPPTLHFETPNPNIDFTNNPFYVNKTLIPWETSMLPRRAGVSSFGIGGTNAHLVLEEAPESINSPTKKPWQLLVLSAKTENALEMASKNLAEYLIANPESNLADIAYTLQIGRRAFSHRRIIASNSTSHAIETLKVNNPQQVFTSHNIDSKPPVVFMFSGQGSQYIGMAKELYQNEPIFQKYLDKCFAILKTNLDMDLHSIIYPNEQNKLASAIELDRILFTLPALFSIEYSLARFWIELGVKPWAMIGYSQGEYIAACLSGVFSLEDALALVLARGRLMETLPKGAMLSVAMSETELLNILPSELSLAIVSSDNLSIASGDIQAIEDFFNFLTNKEIECKKLNVHHAYHSHMAKPILEHFTQEVKKISLHPPQIPYLSNVTGTWITKEQATDPSYWSKHLRQTVRFSDGLIELFKQKELLLLEVGPGKRLTALTQLHINKKPQHTVVASLPPPSFTESEHAFFLNSLGKLWLSGVKISWLKYYGDEQRHRINLPTYPFERDSYWINAPNQTNNSKANSLVDDLAPKPNISDWFYFPSWKQMPYLLTNSEDVEFSPKNYLVFANETPLCERVLTELNFLGHQVTSVKLGEGFSKLLDNYYVNFSQNSYEQLFQSLASNNKSPDIIIHFWLSDSSDSKTIDVLSEINFDEIQQLGYVSLLNTVKALSREGFTHKIKLFFISNNIFSVTGQETLCPAKATTVGLCRVISQENPNIYASNIDISGDLPLETLAKEIIFSTTSPTKELTIAYRGRYRWLPDYQPFLLNTKMLPLKENGVYLITGGLGGYGLEIAEYLAHKVKAKLALVNRSSFPQKSEWQSYLNNLDSSNNPNNEVSQKIKRLQALESLGATILTFSADVTNFHEMQSVVEQVTNKLGNINGVLHLAGLVGGGLIEIKDWSDMANVINTKAKGTITLAKLFLAQKLDFFILFSSINAILSRYGQSDYCGANAFLDAFAYYFNQFTLTISINWETWQDTGMVAVKQPINERANLWKEEMETLTSTMSVKEGVKAFERALTVQVPQVIVSSRNFSLLWKYYQEKLAKIELQNTPTTITQTYSRPILATKYVEASNDTEQKLVEIWQEALGFTPIGIYDNFFDLGGDSVIAIQLAAKANKKGLKISSKQFFEHQTIADLANNITHSQTKIDQEVVTGFVPLTPIQKWFLNQNYHNLNHFNQAVRLKASQPIDSALLGKALQILVTHHDALRMRFFQENGEWQQFNAEVDNNVDFLTTIDLINLSDSEQSKAIESAANKAQKSLDIRQGKVFSALLFSLSKLDYQLLIIAHHLVIDIISWPILLEDLETAYQQLSQSSPVLLPNKTTSFKNYAEKLLVYLESITEEQNYWLTLAWERFSPLFVDYPDQDNNFSNLEQINLSFSVEETNSLIKEITKTYKIRVQDLLIAILAESFSRWADISTVAIDVEMHGREEIAPEIDLSRTVGWFTSVFPLVIDFSKANTLNERVSYVKWYINNIPANNGIGYGLLHLSSDKELLKKLLLLPTPEINFLYLGQTRNTNDQEKLFFTTSDSCGETIDRKQKRRYLFEIVGKVIENKLQINVFYNQRQYKKSTIDLLSQSLTNVVKELIFNAPKNILLENNNNEIEQNKIEFLDISQQKQIATQLGYQPTEVYPLSPQQEGMLLVTLSNPSGEVFIEQSVSKINSLLEIDIFLSAWQQLFNKYEMLRTAFIWENLTQPLQVVNPSVKLSIKQEDWQQFNEQEQLEKLTDILKTSHQNFDLSNPPLMRIILIKISENSYYLIWVYHHILVDGWSIEILLKDLFNTYESLLKGKELFINNITSYKNYIYWLQKQGIEKSITFWSNKLQGFTAPTPLGIPVETHLVSEISYATETQALSEPETNKLKALLKQQRLTFNTLLQGVWTLLLSQYSNQKDIVFGITTSGRPSELVGVEEIVGLFINTLPLRIKVESEMDLVFWLKQLQIDNLELLSHQHNSIGQIYQWAEFPSSLPLYESILVFENHPDSSERFELEPIAFQGAYTKYPLCIMVFPRKTLMLKIVYDCQYFDQDSIKLILGHFLTLLRTISDNWQQSLTSLLNTLPRLEIPQVKIPVKSTSSTNYIAPKTDIEKSLAALLTQLLKKEKIGTQDNFFELGVHSLVATQLLTRITKQFSVEIPLQTLFASPTIAQLALEIDRQTTKNDDENLAKLLAEIEQLSDEQVEELLKQESSIKEEKT